MSSSSESPSRNGAKTCRERALHHRAQRALERQLAYQEKKARSLAAHAPAYIAAMSRASKRTRALLESFSSLPPDARVLEVGSGAHGLVFYFDARRSVGIDPLAGAYASLFPLWQHRVSIIAACGEALPFADASFDVVLSDNVVDHAARPAQMMAEMARVLAPQGRLYFTVNFHHPIYSWASSLHATWNALGVSYEIGPFADHTYHFTLTRARGLIAGLPLRVLYEKTYINEARERAKRRPPRHIGDRLKRLFFKNALYELVAVKE